ncbi:hypothetical protein [Pseudoalteromonas spongiae]|uniref:hypothetical protein n=1 Tax=Pseudoalteromonas spongiae TaxID=298657 RepID=UPI00039190F4|nr:hypothetical protein [Pseudoalteromonas spongiae]ATC99584.1 hypothetical protein PSPO_a2674 [Pseudoalteromonas spongiae UST010723-006]
MKFHLITNCTSSKSSKAEYKLHFSDFINNSNVAHSWLEALNDSKPTIKAIDMYVGDHWNNVREIHNLGVPISIVSAGYGLVSSEHLINSYDATFSANTENSVGQIFKSNYLSERNVEWWKTIHQISSNTSPVKSLVNENLDSFFIIALTPDYLKVLEPELIELVATKKINIMNTAIISRDVSLHSSLKSLHYKNSEDFCHELGGSRISLNIRLAKYLIKDIDKSGHIRNQLENKFNALVLKAKPAKKYNRKKLSDTELMNFIESELNLGDSAKISASVLLRTLRNKGLACEQKRFSSLYRNVINKNKVEML